MANNKEPRLLPTGAAATYLGVRPETLRRWEREGRISPQRTPGGDRRYRLEDLDALLSERTGA